MSVSTSTMRLNHKTFVSTIMRTFNAYSGERAWKAIHDSFIKFTSVYLKYVP